MGALNLYRIPCSSVRTRTCRETHGRGISAAECSMAEAAWMCAMTPVLSVKCRAAEISPLPFPVPSSTDVTATSGDNGAAMKVTLSKDKLLRTYKMNCSKAWQIKGGRLGNLGQFTSGLRAPFTLGSEDRGWLALIPMQSPQGVSSPDKAWWEYAETCCYQP